MLKRRQEIRTNVFTNGMERKLSDYTSHFYIEYVSNMGMFYQMMDQKFSGCHLCVAAPTLDERGELLPLSLLILLNVSACRGRRRKVDRTINNGRKKGLRHVYTFIQLLRQAHAGKLIRNFGRPFTETTNKKQLWLASLYSSWISLANKSLRAYNGRRARLLWCVAGRWKRASWGWWLWSGTRNPPRQAGIYI